MNAPIELKVDLTNPGQFFACCGLFEVAERLSGSATAWFEPGGFRVAAGSLTLADCIAAAGTAGLTPLVETDATASPIRLEFPKSALRLDWWKDRGGGGAELKPWAGGTMLGPRIAYAMQRAMAMVSAGDALLDHGQVVFEPDNPSKKVEPFYFDARRGSNAQSIDVGFSTNKLGMQSLAWPATEFLCLIGLQRFRPRRTEQRRVFQYFTWTTPLRPLVAALAACGVCHAAAGFVFETAFRTDQRKHKAFSPATPLGRMDHEH